MENTKWNNLFLVLIVSVLTVFLSACTSEIYGYTPSELDPDYSNSFSKDSSPENFRAESFYSSEEIPLTWESVRGAKSYQIEREENGTFTVIGTTNKPSYTDRIDKEVISNGSTSFTYRVAALSASGVKSKYSKAATASLLYAPVISVSKGDEEYKGKILVSWKEIEGVEDYIVYCIPENQSSADGPEDVSLQDSSIKFTSYKVDGKNEYLYTPVEKTGSEEIYYFCVVSVSPYVDSNLSPASNFASGYALSENAPDGVSNLVADQGVTNNPENGIKVSFRAPKTDENLSYVIYRSADGEENDISSTPISINNGISSFTDTDGLKLGKVYTYSVIPAITIDGNKILGPSSEAEGFILSPPDEVSFTTLEASGGNYAISISFTEPAGLDGGSDYSVVVYGGRTAGQPESYNIMNSPYTQLLSLKDSMKEIATLDSDTLALDDGTFTYRIEGSEYNAFRIAIKKGSVISVPSGTVAYFSGLNPRNLTASNNYWESSLIENEYGFYPVLIDFEINNFESADSSWYSLVLKNGDEELSIPSLDNTNIEIKDTSSSVMGVKNTYTLTYSDIFGNEISEPLKATGYSSITNNKLVAYWECFAFKPWEHQNIWPNQAWAKSAIYKKINAAGMSSLSNGITETAQSIVGVGTGSVKYVAKVSSSLGGDVTISYNDFSEVDYMATTGGFHMDVSMSQSGTVNGVPNLKISGMYPATVSFNQNQIRVSKGKFSGFYTIEQEARGNISESVAPNQEI